MGLHLPQEPRWGFTCLPVDLSDFQFFLEPCGRLGNKASAAHFHWRHFHLPASLLCFSYNVTASCAQRPSTASSLGTVSSTRKVRWQELDQRTRSGCTLVATITDENVSLWPKPFPVCIQWASIGRKVAGSWFLLFADEGWMMWDFSWILRDMALVVTLIPFISAAKQDSGWFCLQVYLPCVRLILPRRAWGLPNLHTEGRLHPLPFKDLGLWETWMSYVALMVKLSMLVSMLHVSFHVIFLLSIASYLLNWGMALTHPAASWWRTFIVN